MSRFTPCTQEADVCQICNDRNRTCIELYQQHMKFIELHQLHVYGPLLSRRLQEATRMPLDFQKDMISVWDSTCCCIYFNFSLQRYAYIYIYIYLYILIYIYILRGSVAALVYIQHLTPANNSLVLKRYTEVTYDLIASFPICSHCSFSFFC